MVLFTLSISSYYAQTYTTISDDSWSIDGVSGCGCSPGFGDDLVISHFVNMPSGNYTGSIFLNNGGTFYVQGSLITGRFRGSDLLVFQGGKIEVTGNFINYSLAFGNGFLISGGPSINNGTFPGVEPNQVIPNGYFEEESLPVTFIDFNLNKDEYGVHVSWSTSMELNNSYFSIERSYDLENFIEVGRVYGSGDSENILEYIFYDDVQELDKEYYYRIKQFDYDGNYRYSKTVSIDLYNREQEGVYPTLSRGIYNVNIKDIVRCVVFNSKGEVVLDIITEKTKFLKIDISNKPSGVYFVKTLNDKGFFTTHKIIKI